MQEGFSQQTIKNKWVTMPSITDVLGVEHFDDKTKGITKTFPLIAFFIPSGIWQYYEETLFLFFYGNS